MHTVSTVWPTLRDACLQTELATAPRTTVQYGNVGYGLVAIIIERLTGLPFPDALRALVLDPLGIEGTWARTTTHR